MANLVRKYTCDGSCVEVGLQALTVQQIIEHRLAAKGCHDIAVRFSRDEYVTPGEMHILNVTADDAHDIMHTLVMAKMSHIVRELGIENPYEYKYPDFLEDA